MHFITKHPLTKNKPQKKLSKTMLDKKTQKHFVEKKGMYTPAWRNHDQLQC